MSFSVRVQSGDAEEIYWAPVAGDQDMYDLWSSPAASLGFKIIAGIYEETGTIVNGQYLEILKSEVDGLQRWWIENVDDDAVRQHAIAGRTRTFDVPLLVHLMDRSENVAAAIRLAQAVKGTLAIS